MLANYWPRRVAAAEPLAAALLDHHRSGRSRLVRARRSDGVSFDIETVEYFTLEGQLAELDARSLELCRGRVLDVGSGAGRHSLALQELGHEVVAIDVSPICAALCSERGVLDARTFDVMKLEHQDQLGCFDSIFFGMQTIGVAGGIEPLEELLRRLKPCLSPGGELVVDSSELREAWDGDQEDRAATRGEIVLSTRYRGCRGDAFPWVYLAEDDFMDVAQRAGYEMETVARVEGGEYLAVLRLGDEAADPIQGTLDSQVDGD